jgi:hypothetical protein
MTFSLDTTESADEELAGTLLIKEATKRIQAIIDLPEWAYPASGSPMAEADKLTPIQPMSYHLRSSNMVAVDNLRATVRYIEKTNDVVSFLADCADARAFITSAVASLSPSCAAS